MSPAEGRRQRVLVVDDEREVVTGFRRVFERDGDITIEAAFSGHEALQAIRADCPDLVLIDLRMPGLDGLQALKKMQEINPRLLVILMTAYGSSATVIEAMKHGAYDYLVKPFGVEKLREVVREALKVAQDVRTVVSPEPSLASEEQELDTIIGKSEGMQRVYKMIGQVAASNACVLITGERGTGKEMVARAIFRHGERSGQPFVTVSCGAIPEALLESELFGHERGAFTNATTRRVGKFELANGGTLFVDDIADLPAATQAKLLRVLQSGEFERLGGTDTVRVDVRVIAATTRPLEPLTRNGDFRLDLYYRLNVVRLQLPALRERREDIPSLIEFFLRKQNSERKDKERRISSAAVERLVQYAWPGNVRELETTIRNAVLTAKGETILSTDIQLKGEAPTGTPPGPAKDEPAPGPAPAPPEAPGATAGSGAPPPVVEDRRFEDVEQQLEPLFETLVAARERGNRFSLFDVVERALLIQALNRTGGNQLRAAKLLGITRSTLRKRIARYGIQIQTTVRRVLPE